MVHNSPNVGCLQQLSTAPYMLELSAQPLSLSSSAHRFHKSGNRVASARAMRKQVTFVTGNLKKREEVHMPLLQALLYAQI